MAESIWSGADGTVYAYKSFEPAASWNDVPGNYIFARMERNVWIPLYIGETDSFARRLTPQHEKWQPAVASGMTHILAHTGNTDRGIRRTEEQNLIKRHRPPLNDQPPGLRSALGG